MVKMNQKLLTDLIYDEYQEKGIEMTVEYIPVYHIKPLIDLTTDQKKTLSDGDGQKEGQYTQINSSTGLVVNYYKILEDLGCITNLVFENKVAKPLNTSGGKFANLDANYKRDGSLYFVESKFLEPYYSDNEKINDSYLDEQKYPTEVKNNQDDWKKLFLKSEEFKCYNFTQLCRHLLAIYRYTHGYKESKGSMYEGEPVVFQSVIWKPTNKFIEKLDVKNQNKLNERVKKLEEEAAECEKSFNEFIARIGWENMEFKTLHYNDILDEIKPSKHYSEFCKRYFFE